MPIAVTLAVLAVAVARPVSAFLVPPRTVLSPPASASASAIAAAVASVPTGSSNSDADAIAIPSTERTLPSSRLLFGKPQHTPDDWFVTCSPGRQRRPYARTGTERPSAPSRLSDRRSAFFFFSSFPRTAALSSTIATTTTAAAASAAVAQITASASTLAPSSVVTQRGDTSMLLDSKSFARIASLSPPATAVRRRIAQPNEQRRPTPADNHRVLGFDMASFGFAEASPSSTRLGSRVRSNFDIDMWNDAEQQPSNAINFSSDDNIDDDTSLSWFPWIPTKSQIWSLQKINELRAVCAQRSLDQTGNKQQLRHRLWEWTVEQQAQQQRTNDFLLESFQGSAASSAPGKNANPNNRNNDRTHTRPIPVSDSMPNSLQEWARTVDLDPLLQRRRKIRQQREDGGTFAKSVNDEDDDDDEDEDDENDDQDKAVNGLPRIDSRSRAYTRKKKYGKADGPDATKEYLLSLTKAVEAPSSPYSSNEKVHELYIASKQADQLGERVMAKRLLQHLIELTPNDGRLYRRLSRMAAEEGDIISARKILLDATRKLPDNAFLWHGLGQLELKHGGVPGRDGTDSSRARFYFLKAIEVDPTLAHAYHALGIMEHTNGHVAQALKVLQNGIRDCPTNHRLHHALGDVYRGAKLLKDAERSYRRALKYGSSVSHTFAYSALAAVAYERGDMGSCRRWLRDSVSINNGRHAQGWVALAQMEESLGNIEAARAVSAEAISKYEYGLIEMNQHFKRQFQRSRSNGNVKRRRVNGERTNHFKPRSRVATSTGPQRKPPTRRLKIPSLSTSGPHDEVVSHLAIKNVLLRSVPPYRSGDKFVRVFRNWARLEERHGTFEMVNDVYSRATTAFPNDYRITLDWAKYHATIKNLDRARSLFTTACTKMMSSSYGAKSADPFRAYANFEMDLGNYVQARSILFYGARMLTQSAADNLKLHSVAQLYHTWAVCEWRLNNAPRARQLFDHTLRLVDPNSDDGSKLRAHTLYSMARLHYDSGEYHLAQHCVGLCLKENAMSAVLVWQLWADIAREMENPHLEALCLKYQHESVAEEPKLQDWIRQDPWYLKLFGTEIDDKQSCPRLPPQRTMNLAEIRGGV